MASAKDSKATESVELVRQAQAGNLAAYNRLFSRYYPRVRRIVSCRMGAQLKLLDDPEDLVQNTFIEAVRTFARFEIRHEASLIHWFAKLVENQISNRSRYHKALKRNQEQDVVLAKVRQELEHGEFQLESVPGDKDVLDRLASQETQLLLDECLSKLSEDFREVILLRDYAQGPWEWIAEKLNRASEGAVRELHRRARLRLMELAKKHPF